MTPLHLGFCFLLVGVFAQTGDENKSMRQLVEQHGFALEEIPITTADGYICTMHRLSVVGKTPTLGPALLQHGLLDSSVTWVLNSPAQSLGFLMATEGYDVYLGNSRGNKWSSSHQTLNPNSNEFWQFSFDQMAMYDIPAFVDTVLNRTGHSRLVYVGHSQGTTQMFAALTEFPSLQNKIEVFAALAPATHVANTNSSLLRGMAVMRVDELVKWLGIGRFYPTSSIAQRVAPHLCSNWLTAWICDSAIWFVPAFTPDDQNRPRVGVYAQHFPSSTSSRNMMHWAQIIREGVFRRFDLGGLRNMEAYGSPLPPIYNLSALTFSDTDLLLFTGGLDQVANGQDVQRLINTLPQPPTLHVRLSSYDHADLVWGSFANRDIYRPLMDHIATRRSRGASTWSRMRLSLSSGLSVGATVGIVVGCVAAVVVAAAAFAFSRKRRSRQPLAMLSTPFVSIDVAPGAGQRI